MIRTQRIDCGALQAWLVEQQRAAKAGRYQLRVWREELTRRNGVRAALVAYFQEALDETRCEYAQQLLDCTQLKIADIATIVGYADPSILTRGFVRWAGVTPSQWRAAPGREADTCAGAAF